MRKLCWILAPVLILLSACVQNPALAPARPNIILVLTDDQRYDAPGFPE